MAHASHDSASRRLASTGRITAGLGLTALTGAALGAGALAYGALVEARDFRVRREQLRIVPPGGLPLRILHLSDIHLLPGNHAKLEWLSTLHLLQPDLVVNTGDNISSADSIEPLLDALGPLLDVPGVFVPGSNDYYEPKSANPLRYFRGPSALDEQRTTLPYRRLFDAFERHGWIDLTNAQHTSVLRGTRLDLAGTDDPHLGLDRWPGFPGVSNDPARILRIGVTHAPYRRVLDAMVQDGADLVLAGHTHGGQICLPSRSGGRALVTNCDLPTAQASGLSTWTRFDRSAPLQVSAGIGAAPTFPVRLFCKPEAVLLDLEPVVPPVRP